MKETLAFLGPEGTFSHKAALKYIKNNPMDLIPCSSIFDAIDAVDNNKASCALVPVENSIEGSINVVLDELVKRVDLNIIAEYDLRVTLNLLAKKDCDYSRIKRIYSHYQPIAQCKDTIKNLYPSAELIPMNSTAKAAEMISKDKDCEIAAIGTDIAAEIYNLQLVHKEINDFKENKTRFILLSKKTTSATGKDKTSIAFTARADKPGSLYNILGIFAEQKINLTKIESRPTKESIGNYIFFIDFEGHISDPTIVQVLEKVKKHAISLNILGSYNILEGDINA